jgi:hypothetical protein
MKANSFPWFTWWRKMEEKHYLTVIALGFVLGAVLIYLASELARDVSEMQIAQDRTAVSSAERSEFCG